MEISLRFCDGAKKRAWTGTVHAQTDQSGRVLYRNGPLGTEYRCIGLGSKKKNHTAVAVTSSQVWNHSNDSLFRNRISARCK